LKKLKRYCETLLAEENRLISVLGFDIGGANTKAAFLEINSGKIERLEVAVQYFPIWKKPENLIDILLTLRKKLGAGKLDGLGVTMTAELSDAFATKREGVHRILACVKKAFPDVPIYVLRNDCKLEPATKAEENPLAIAAANWAATGWLVAQHFKDCIVVDVGSTSASIIPIVNGKVAAKGKTDLEKIMCGELVYTGSLRTNIATIVHSVPIKKGVAGLASELFALSADVHLALGNINEKQYTCETADGRGKTLSEALARIARVVCADTEILTQEEIISLAKYIYDKQITQVAEGLTKVYDHVKTLTSKKISVIVTGLGKDFIARKSAEKVLASDIIDVEAMMTKHITIATPAYGVALMLAEKLGGKIVQWMPP
jgi:probable H4MPT-linked C1 transfer pathway protein